MTGLLKREPRHVDARAVLDPLERMFDDWTRTMMSRWPGMFPRDWTPEQLIHVNEYREDGAMVVRAELPGIDPDKDVDLSVADGMLRIHAERREESSREEKGYVRKELRSGTFLRVLPMPEGVNEADIAATYADGILEIRIPSPEPKAGTKIPISKA